MKTQNAWANFFRNKRNGTEGGLSFSSNQNLKLKFVKT